MAYSRLAVVIVGDLPPHALATALMPLRDAIKEGPWPNRELLMLPLARRRGTGQPGVAAWPPAASVQVRTTPLVTRPAEAWNYVRGTWNKVRAQLRDTTTTLLAEIIDTAAVPTPSAASAASSTQPGTAGRTGSAAGSGNDGAAALARLPMQPMPPRACRVPAAATVDPALATYVRKCGELKGMVSCCVFELATQRTIGHAGTRPGPAALASQGATLMASMAEAAHALNLGDAAPDAAITLGSHHQLLRAVPGRPGLALHAVLDRGLANLTLVRLQLQRLDLLLEDGRHAL